MAVILGDEMDHPGVDHVGIRPAELLGGHRFAGDLLDDLRPGDEELGLAGLDDEVGERRAVGRPAAQGPQISEICGTIPDSSTLALSTLAVALQRIDALLHPRAARIVDEHKGQTRLEGLVHDLGDLYRMHLRPPSRRPR